MPHWQDGNVCLHPGNPDCDKSASTKATLNLFFRYGLNSSSYTGLDPWWHALDIVHRAAGSGKCFLPRRSSLQHPA